MHDKVACKARPMLHYPNYIVSQCWLGWRISEAIVRPGLSTCPWTTGPPSIQVGGSGHVAAWLRHWRLQLGEQQTVHQATRILSSPQQGETCSSLISRAEVHGPTSLGTPHSIAALSSQWQASHPSESPASPLYLASGMCAFLNAIAQPRPWLRRGQPLYQEPWPVKPAASTYCMIRGSSPPYGNTHLRHRTFMTPGTSCTWMSIVLGSAHKVIIKQTHINNTTTYLIGSVPPKRSGPMIRLLGQLGLIVGSRLHSIKRLHIWYGSK